MTADLTIEDVCRILGRAGYDVVADDVVSGRRESAGRVYTVTVDRGGRIKLVRTEIIEEPASKVLEADGKRFRLVEEKLRIATISGEIAAPEELQRLLPSLERALRE